MHEGVDIEISKNQKDELALTGNNLESGQYTTKQLLLYSKGYLSCAI